MQEKPIYSANEHSVTMEQIVNATCSLPLSDPNFEKPTPAQIRFVRDYLGLSQAKLGRLLGKPVTKRGCAMVRKWETAIGHTEHRWIDANAWRRMLHAANIADISEDMDLVK